MEVETPTASKQSPSLSRRSIMPSIYSDKETKRKNMKDQSPSFSPYARVLAIESQKDLSEEEKNDIWWQKSDYEEFRKATSKLVQTMTNENIHGWMGCKKEDSSLSLVVPLLPVASNDQQSPTKRQIPPKRTVDEQENHHHVSQKAKRETNGDEESPAMRWWERFGDLACFHESRRRQTEVTNSIKAVLEEQRRQKMFQTSDPMKTRVTYIQATTWARDWALALATANAADVLQNSTNTPKDYETIASSLFEAKEALSAALSKPKTPVSTAVNRLDANTSSQILFRQVRSREEVIQRRLARRIAASQGSSTSTDSTSTDNESESSKPTELALAKKAAGFGADICPSAAMTALLSS